MKSNTKYLLPESLAKTILPRLSEYVHTNLPPNDIQSTVLIEEYFCQENGPVICFQQIYRSDQVQQGRLVGKPYRLNLTSNIINSTELGFTAPTEVRKIIKFLGLTELGKCTHLRTTFPLRDKIVSIPITISEIKELGNFIEIGEVVGPIKNIEQLMKILSMYGLHESWECSQSYLDLLMERGRK